MTTPLSTAQAAKAFIALMLVPLPRISTIPAAVDQQVYTSRRVTTRLTSAQRDGDSNWGRVEQATSIAPIHSTTQCDDTDRPTTSLEKLVGELRGWQSLTANWDGEGAAVPDAKSLKEAVSFVRLLGERDPLPEPMLHASGHAGLFWKDDNLYADIEFLGDRRIAYYIEHQGDKHKGVVKFDSQNMPAVFPALLPA